MPGNYHCGYVSIIGRPNVGKSTLLNRLIGQKISITSKKPQTTRWQLLGIRTTPACQIIFVDTPGLPSRHQNSMNRHMQREILDSLSCVHAILFVIEALVWTETEDQILKIISNLGYPVILVVNKIDKLKNKEKLLPFISSLSGKFNFREIIPASALKEDNIGVIEQKLVPCLPLSPAEFPEDQLSDRNERFFAAEFIREKLTRLLGAELPYRISVTIDQFAEQGALLDITASIWVETENQKKIVIGQNGKILKKVGEQSRKDMEKMFGKKVYLKTWAKVRKKWTADARSLKQLGYDV